jgi:hypothetical protein
MRSKKLKAFVFVTLLLASQTLTVFAQTFDDGGSHTIDGSTDGVTAYEETTVVVNGDVSNPSAGSYGHAVQAYDGSSITVNGNVSDGVASISRGGENTVTVTVKGNVTGNKGQSQAVDAEGEKAIVNVDGNVASAGGYAVRADEGATVTIGGNVERTSDYEKDSFSEVFCTGEARVTIGGNVTDNAQAFSNGHISIAGNAGSVYSLAESDVSVGGNVGSSDYDYVAADAEDGSTLTIGGNVASNKRGVEADGGSKVIVKGDVTSGELAIGSTLGGTVIVEGTITGSLTKNDSPVIRVNGTKKGNDGKPATIITYQIKGNLDNMVDAYSFDEHKKKYNDEALKASQIKNIFYIIKTEAGSASNISGIAGTVKKEGYDTAVENTVLTVTVKEGYGVKAGTIEVTKNADGTYSLVVPRGGGVTITAEQLIKAVEDANKNGDDNHDSSNNNQSSNVGKVVTVTNTTPVITGNVISASIDASSLTQKEYDEKVTGMITSAPAGGVVSLTVTNAAYLDENIVNALAARRDVSMEMTVTFMGVPYKITIPAGYDLKKLIGPDGKISFDTILKTFGANKSN